MTKILDFLELSYWGFVYGLNDKEFDSMVKTYQLEMEE